MSVFLKNRKGFSLLEIMIAMMILGLALQLLMEVFDTSKKTENHNDTLFKIRTSLYELLQEYAESPDTFPNMVLGSGEKIVLIKCIDNAGKQSGSDTMMAMPLADIDDESTFVNCPEVLDTEIRIYWKSNDEFEIISLIKTLETKGMYSESMEVAPRYLQ